VDRVEVETAGWVRAGHEVETVDVLLTYEPTDPFAVRVDVAGPGRRSAWVFARDLLADGLRSLVPMGEGAVQVHATSVLTEIHGADEHGRPVVLRLPWWNTREFVRLTQSLVPRGQERCDVDAWVAGLTASTDP